MFPVSLRILVSKIWVFFGFPRFLEGLNSSGGLVGLITTTPGTYKPSGFRAMAISVNKLTSKNINDDYISSIEGNHTRNHDYYYQHPYSYYHYYYNDYAYYCCHYYNKNPCLSTERTELTSL